MIISSPKFSFVEFDVNNNVCGGNNAYSLPAIDLGIKFQINIESLNKANEKLYVAICNNDCETIVDEEIEVEKALTEWKFLQEPEPNELFDFCEEDTQETLELFDFSQSPYIPIPKGSDFILDIPPLPTGTISPNKSTLIFSNGTLTQIYVVSDDVIPSTHSILFSYGGDPTPGNPVPPLISVIRVKYNSSENQMRENLKDAFNYHVPLTLEKVALGLILNSASAINTGTTVKLVGVNNSTAFVAYDNIDGSVNQPPKPLSGTTKNYIYNMIWMQNKLYWFNFHRYYGNDWEGKTANFTINNINLIGREGAVLTVKFKYNNSNAYNVRLKIDIKDDGYKLAPTETVFLNANTESEIIHQVILPPHYGNSNTPFDLKGQLVFWFDDIDNHLWENDLTFWIDDVEVICDNRLNITTSINTAGYTIVKF